MDASFYNMRNKARHYVMPVVAAKVFDFLKDSVMSQ